MLCPSVYQERTRLFYLMGDLLMERAVAEAAYIHRELGSRAVRDICGWL